MAGMIVMVLGGGDLASGVAWRLRRAGLNICITELPQPLAVRRLVSFAEAVTSGSIAVEGVTARRAEDLHQAQGIMERGEIPVLVDPTVNIVRNSGLRSQYPRVVLVDGRMTKKPPEVGLDTADLIVGLGPGFVAGKNCHAVVETNRGPGMGRVLWQGSAEADTGVPEAVAQRRLDRVLRAPVEGFVQPFVEIGAHLESGQLIAEIAGVPLLAPFQGVLRGLISPQARVWPGLKIGDIDPRDDPRLCWQISDKALAVGGGVLEAILSHQELRPFLWG
jgi:xanthine dehydrogenase accessory factor